MQAQRTNFEVIVGLFSTIAIIALIMGWGWLKSWTVEPPQRFTARFTDVAGLPNSATISVQGLRVGNVESVNFTPEKMIDVHLKITNPTVRVPEGAEITIQTIGLVGAKYIEIALPPDTKNKPPIPEGTLVRGIDPPRTELAMNRALSKIDNVLQGISSEDTKEAIRNINLAAVKLNKNMDVMQRGMENVEVAAKDFGAASKRFAVTADKATGAMDEADSFFHSGTRTFDSVRDVAVDFKSTSGRLRKLMDSPNFSGDLKETMRLAKATADTVSGAMHNFSTTLQDKPLREELINILSKMQQSTENIHKSMQILNKISADESLRADLKQTVSNAKEAMEKANNVLGDPAFKNDVRSTLGKVRSAATNVDIASKQLQQVLSKRSPLLQMMFGKPGRLCDEELKKLEDGAPTPGK
jgi:phospholipid/cholesterol/gamma-HCH transport system substrate-binding protein